jgi:subtilisin family serine protease
MTASRKLSRRNALTAAAAALALGLGLALPGAASAQAPEGQILGANSANAVKGSYIVTLHESAMSSSSAEAKGLAKKFNAEITDVYEHALNGFAIEANEKQAKRLAAHPAVESVAQNETVQLSATQINPPSWGLDRIDQPDRPLNQRYTYPDHGGRGVTVYILDTGINYSHNDFGGRAVPGFDAFGGNGSDGNGHGTHVAGTVGGTQYGVAKNVRLVSVKVLNNSGSGTIAGVVGGVDWVTRNATRPAVANMSLGGGANTTLDNAVRNSVAAGVTYAVAAGNSNANAGNSSPARVAQAITVGATTSTDARASYSNWGTSVQIFAPGSSITAPWIGSNSATRSISGTSMAAPHVAGAAALYLATNTSASPATVWNALDQLSAKNKLTGIGTGSPNKLLQVPQ